MPERGGDTLFADMYAAYEALDESTKSQIDDLVGVHDFIQTFGHGMSKEERRQARERYPQVEHPVVCTHPGTGRLHLYVNRPFVSHIAGMDPDESRALLDLLCRQTDSPEHQCRFTWTNGRGGVLGQPGRAALRVQRLLAAAQDDGAGVDHGGASGPDPHLSCFVSWRPPTRGHPAR